MTWMILSSHQTSLITLEPENSAQNGLLKATEIKLHFNQTIH